MYYLFFKKFRYDQAILINYVLKQSLELNISIFITINDIILLKFIKYYVY
jgi:hypothetical protein